MRKTKIRTELAVRDDTSKKDVHNSEHRREIDDGDPLPAGPVAIIKVSSGATFSMGYQSVRVNVGVELPWPVRPGPDAIEDAKPGFEAAYGLIDDELSGRSRVTEDLLKKLVRTYSR